MQVTDLILFAFFIVAGPAIVAAIFMGWLHRRSLRKRMQQGQRPPLREFDEATSGGLRRSTVSAGHAATMTLNAAAARTRDTAAWVTARVRLAYVTAWLVYAAVNTFVFVLFTTPRIGLDAKIAISYAALAPQILILLWAIRMPLRRRWLIFLVNAIAGLALLFVTIKPDRAMVILANVPIQFALLIIAALLILFIRRQQPFLIALFPIFGLFVVQLVLYIEYTSESQIALQKLKVDPWLIAIALAGTVLAVVFLFALARLRWRLRLSTILVVIAGALLLDREITSRTTLPIVLQILYFALLPVVQLFLLWALFKMLVWVQGRRFLTNDLIHIHLCWGFLTLYFVGTTKGGALYESLLAARWGFLVAFVLHGLVLHALLGLLRRARPAVTEYRLLLLRVFGRTDKREKLLDDLNDTWRRIGTVDLIAATDLTSRTLRSTMLEAFVLRRSDEQFLHNEGEVDALLKHKPSTIEGDVRYPVNAYYCYDSIWHIAFQRLADASDVVALMDVRGFTARSTSCAWELGHLLRHKPLDQIILIADDQTDEKALDVILRKAPGTGALNVLAWDHRSSDNQRALFTLLLRALPSADPNHSEDSLLPRPLTLRALAAR